MAKAAGYRITAVITALAGSVLVGLGAWVLAAEVARAPASSPVRGLEADAQPTVAELRVAEQALAQAVRIRSVPDYFADLGLVRFVRWGRLAPDERLDVLNQVRAATERGLAQAPADPFLWTRLAMVRYLGGEPTTSVARALELAGLTGPNVSSLHLPRAELVLRLWPAGNGTPMPGWAQAIVQRAFRSSPEETVKLARQIARIETLRAVAATSEESRQRLETILDAPG